MKKLRVAVLVLLIVTAAVVLPAGYFGEEAERTLRDRLANMPSGFAMEVVEYERGWFSSTARIEWAPLGGRLPGSVVLPSGATAATVVGDVPLAWLAEFGPVAIDLEIAHGPVFFSVAPGAGLFLARGRVALGDPAPDAKSESDGVEEAQIEFQLSSFSGAKVSSRLDSPGFAQDFGPVDLSIDALQVEGEWSGASAFQLQRASLGGMSVSLGKPDGVRMALTDFSSRTVYSEGVEGGALLAPASASVYLEEFLVAGSDDDIMLFVGGVDSEIIVSREESGLYRRESDTSIESMELMGREFSPVEIRQVYGRLSDSALRDFFSAVNSMRLEPPPREQVEGDTAAETPGGQPVPQSSGAVSALSPELARAIVGLLASGPFYDLDAGLTYKEQHGLEFGLGLGYEGEKAPLIESLGLAPALLDGIEIAVDFSVPAAIAGELLGENVFQLARLQGLLRESGENFSLSVSMSQGTLTVNGTPMPLPLPGSAPPESPPSVPPEAPPG